MVNCLVVGSNRMTWLAAMEFSQTLPFGWIRMVFPLAEPLFSFGSSKTLNSLVFVS